MHYPVGGHPISVLLLWVPDSTPHTFRRFWCFVISSYVGQCGSYRSMVMSLRSSADSPMKTQKEQECKECLRSLSKVGCPESLGAFTKLKKTNIRNRSATIAEENLLGQHPLEPPYRLALHLLRSKGGCTSARHRPKDACAPSNPWTGAAHGAWRHAWAPKNAWQRQLASRALTHGFRGHIRFGPTSRWSNEKRRTPALEMTLETIDSWCSFSASVWIVVLQFPLDRCLLVEIISACNGYSLQGPIVLPSSNQSLFCIEKYTETLTLWHVYLKPDLGSSCVQMKQKHCVQLVSGLKFFLEATSSLMVKLFPNIYIYISYSKTILMCNWMPIKILLYTLCPN